MTEETAEEEAPTIIQVRAIDVKPNHYGIWCSIAGRKPFINPIVLRRWSEDGQQISFMLDSHNFQFCKWDEMMDVVPYEMYPKNKKLLAECDARDAEDMKHRPVQPPEWLKTFPTLLRRWHTLGDDQLNYQAEIIQLAAMISRPIP